MLMKRSRIKNIENHKLFINFQARIARLPGMGKLKNKY